jgi:hypothetical protein
MALSLTKRLEYRRMATRYNQETREESTERYDESRSDSFVQIESY